MPRRSNLELKVCILNKLLEKPSKPSRLAGIVGVNYPKVCALLKDMEAHNLIKAFKIGGGKQRLYAITDEGKALLNQLKTLVEKIGEQIHED